MIPSPAKCRSRIRALRAWISACPPDKPGEKGSARKLMLYGVVPEEYNLDGWLKEDMNVEDDNDPLDLVESMTLDTWFFQHPDKVCGKEVLTSSREFPLTIKGTREDCETVFQKYLGPLHQMNPTDVPKQPESDNADNADADDWRKLSRADLIKRAELWVEVWRSYPAFITDNYQILQKYENGFISTIVKADKKTAKKLAGLLWDELHSTNKGDGKSEDEALAALALMQMVELEMEAGLSGASNGTVTYYNINDTLSSIRKETKGGKPMYRVETFRAYMPAFLLNSSIPNTNVAWFPTIRMCKRHVDEIDVLNYYAFDEHSKSYDTRMWLASHPNKNEGIFELPQ